MCLFIVVIASLILLLFHFSACVCCTDLPEVVPLIEVNRDINQNLISGTFVAKSLKWYVWYLFSGYVPHAIHNLLFAIYCERMLQKKNFIY